MSHRDSKCPRPNCKGELYTKITKKFPESFASSDPDMASAIGSHPAVEVVIRVCKSCGFEVVSG